MDLIPADVTQEQGQGINKVWEVVKVGECQNYEQHQPLFRSIKANESQELMEDKAPHEYHAVAPVERPVRAEL